MICRAFDKMQKICKWLRCNLHTYTIRVGWGLSTHSQNLSGCKKTHGDQAYPCLGIRTQIPRLIYAYSAFALTITLTGSDGHRVGISNQVTGRGELHPDPPSGKSVFNY